MNRHQRIILLAGMLVTLVLGSIHSFSVFLVPFEKQLSVGRAQVSLLYSFALIFLTVSVLFGYLIYNRIRPGGMIVFSCLLAATGLLVSTVANSWWLLWFGYSVLFGSANGIGYGYVLQLVGKAAAERKGFAMAAVTAAYAVGSVVFSLLLAHLVSNYSTVVALSTMAGIIILAGFVAALTLVRAGARYTEAPSSEPVGRADQASSIGLWWLAYGCSVFAGLMAIGHAAGIVQSLGGAYEDSIWGAVWIGVGSATGGFIVGTVINAEKVSAFLLGLPLLSALSLVALAFVSSPSVAVMVLTTIGFAYGALIAVYPFAIAINFGDLNGPKVYGRVFTAWGFAGLAGPWCAGRLFDFSGSYGLALFIASAIAFGSSVFYGVICNKLQRPAA